MKRINGSRLLDIFNHQLDEIEKEAESKGHYLHLRAPLIAAFTLSHAAVLYEMLFICNTKENGHALIALNTLEKRTGLGRFELRTIVNNLLEYNLVTRITTGTKGQSSEYVVNVDTIIYHMKERHKLFRKKRKAPQSHNLTENSSSNNIFAHSTSEGTQTILPDTAQNGVKTTPMPEKGDPCGVNTPPCGISHIGVKQTQKWLIPDTYININNLIEDNYKIEEEGVKNFSEEKTPKERLSGSRAPSLGASETATEEASQDGATSPQVRLKVSRGPAVIGGPAAETIVDDPLDILAHSKLDEVRRRDNGVEMSRGDTGLYHTAKNEAFHDIYKRVIDSLRPSFRKLSFKAIGAFERAAYDIYVRTFVMATEEGMRPTLSRDDLVWSKGRKFYKEHGIQNPDNRDDILRTVILGDVLGKVLRHKYHHFSVSQNKSALEAFAARILGGEFLLQDVISALLSSALRGIDNVGFLRSVTEDLTARRKEYGFRVGQLDALGMTSFWKAMNPSCHPDDYMIMGSCKPDSNMKKLPVEYAKLHKGAFFLLANSLYDMDSMEITDEEVASVLYNAAILMPYFCDTEEQSKETYLAIHEDKGALSWVLRRMLGMNLVSSDKCDWDK